MGSALELVKIPELKKRVIFTVTMLAIYRFGVHVPTPGVDTAALTQLFMNLQGTIFSWFNFFSGGALERFSIFALGVQPYITSSILFQLLPVASPYFQELQKDGEHGRKKITQYTRYATVLISIIQSFVLATALEHQTAPTPVVLQAGIAFKLMTICTLTAGTMFLMWLGEQISERGISNGISLIIFAGIAARIPQGLTTAIRLVQTKELSVLKFLSLGGLSILAFYAIVYIERALRKILVQYAKRIVGQNVYGGQNTHLPLKINSAGVMPPIFASSLIMLPATLATFIPFKPLQIISQSLQQPTSFLYNTVFVSLIIFFCYFYTAVQFNTADIADNLKKYGGFIPGIRPGSATAAYISYVLNRITVAGAAYISLVCVLPTFLTQTLNVPFYFGGTSILILVGVSIDTISQVETFFISKDYDGFMRHTQSRSRTTPL